MDLLISLATTADRLDPAIGALLDHFRDERVAAAPFRRHRRRGGGAARGADRLGRRRVGAHPSPAPAGAVLRRGRRISGGISRGSTAACRRRCSAAPGPNTGECLKQGEAGVLYLRRPDEYLGLAAIDSRSFPARFFAAAHGYFIGVGLAADLRRAGGGAEIRRRRRGVVRSRGREGGAQRPARRRLVQVHDLDRRSRQLVGAVDRGPQHDLSDRERGPGARRRSRTGDGADLHRIASPTTSSPPRANSSTSSTGSAWRWPTCAAAAVAAAPSTRGAAADPHRLPHRDARHRRATR